MRSLTPIQNVPLNIYFSWNLLCPVFQYIWVNCVFKFILQIQANIWVPYNYSFVSLCMLINGSQLQSKHFCFQSTAHDSFIFLLIQKQQIVKKPNLHWIKTMFLFFHRRGDTWLFKKRSHFKWALIHCWNCKVEQS